MGVYHIEIAQSFNAPVDTIFSTLTDHQAFGQVINVDIKLALDKTIRKGLKKLSERYDG